jgi:proteasome lid subunit RPN8/RPN11
MGHPPDAGGLVLDAGVRRALEEHARRIYPEECCGVLIGAFDGSRKVVRASHPIDNARRDSARNRYLMGGEAVRGAEAEARRFGADIVGYYHSHPDVPAVPSETDRREATWPIYSYVILSVRKGEIAELRSWTLSEDRERMNEEPVLDRP